jgi:neutral ceramidase
MKKNKYIGWFSLCVLTLCSLCLCGSFSSAAEIKAGVASRVITPTEPLWMAGYANRTKPAEGKQHDLHVKALALEDSAGTTLVLVTSDLIGLPRSLSDAVAAEVQRKAGLPRERLMLTASHTHCGPVLNGNLMDMYPIGEPEKAAIARYTDRLAGTMAGTVLAALADRKPARLAYGGGTARFAMNRRQVTPKGIINGRNPDGPVDHSVPVLAVLGTDGALRAAVFGYACHNTTLSYQKWCGDYAGFAQLALQAKHPGAEALFWIGCGADANPLPRGKVELAEQYGKDLAAAVDGVLAGSMTPVRGTFAARYATIPLAFAHEPTRAELQADLLDKNHTKRHRAERFLKILDSGGHLPTEYPAYPIQVWRLGDGPLWVALGGEDVVDYDLRLTKELAGPRPVWVTGYANDVMAYIPSERVLQEGGYEGDTSMIPYGQPSKWAPGLEAKIVGKVHELAKEVAAK